MSESHELLQHETVPEETFDESLLNVEDNDSSEDEESDEIETFDVTNEPIYHILSAFFEDDDGNNMINALSDLTSAVEKNTKVMSRLLKTLAK